MRHLVFLLEEPSAREMLEGVVPKIIPESSGIAITYIVFEGKQDLEKRVKKKLEGWRTPDSCFIVMRDQDSGNCYTIKSTLQHKVDQAGKKDCTLIRIACRELEAFYLGDLAAVETALNIPRLASKQGQKKFRDPDIVGNAAEELKTVTQKQYQKIAGSRAIGPHMDLHNNKSTSFNMLVAAIRKLLSECEGC